MILESIRLHNYRNYEELSIKFDEGIHILFGANAQGKTNILEAILYLSTTRSHRTKDDQNLILQGAEAFFIKAEIVKQNRKENLQVSVNEKGKNLFIYQDPVVKVSDFIGEFNAVMFCPDDMMLFNASPKVRRRFIDIELSKVSKKYMNTLNVAQKLLKERNACLKQDSVDLTYLDVITDQLIDASVIIIKQRHHFFEKLLMECRMFYEQLTQDDTALDIDYQSCALFDEDECKVKDELKKIYEKDKNRDMYLKQTNHGVHKEDFAFKLNEMDINDFASQGQKRSVLLAVKIGLVMMIKKITNEYPILLLDDVFSELDEIRKLKLLMYLPESVQIFITTTERLNLNEIRNKRKVSVWNIHQGTIRRCEGGNSYG